MPIPPTEAGPSGWEPTYEGLKHEGGPERLPPQRGQLGAYL
jgi:hypothetical protein